MRKVVMGNGGFCIAPGIVAFHKKGVWGQFLIKKRKYWPRFVPGDYIDKYMREKPLGFSKMFVQIIKGTRFLINCTKDRDYVTKIMSMHGLLDEIHWQLMDGMWKTFKYSEPFSCHHHGKHWVDNVNNC
jgi:hypothetical protein